MLDAVSCSDAACSSVRCDRSVLPLAISRAPTSIDSAPRCTAPTIVVRLVLHALDAREQAADFVACLSASIGLRQIAARDALEVIDGVVDRLHDQAAQREARADQRAAPRARARAMISVIISDDVRLRVSRAGLRVLLQRLTTADAAVSNATNIGLIFVSAIAWYAAMSFARIAANSGSTPSCTARRAGARAVRRAVPGRRRGFGVSR